jgi:hypothetical protein
MSYIFNSQVLIWLLLIIVAIFSFFNFYLFIKLLRKFDDHQILTVDALELLNLKNNKISKDIEVLAKRSRILNNESKENIRKQS